MRAVCDASFFGDQEWSPSRRATWNSGGRSFLTAALHGAANVDVGLEPGGPVSRRAGTRIVVFVHLPARQETGPPEQSLRKMRAVCDASFFGDQEWSPSRRATWNSGGRSFLTAALHGAANVDVGLEPGGPVSRRAGTRIVVFVHLPARQETGPPGSSTRVSARPLLIPTVSNIDTGAIVIQRSRDVVRRKGATFAGATDGVS
jgi:hypothetical protein